MNSILRSTREFTDVQRPIALTYYALIQAYLIAAGGTGNELVALEPSCTGRETTTESRKVKVMGLVVDMLQSGAPIEDVQAFIQNCNPSTIPTFSITGLMTPLGTITPIGTTGNVTINEPSGTVNIAAGASSVVVTNNLVTTDSLVFAVIRTNDATAILKNVPPANGSFTIRTTANVTGTTSIGWYVVNPRG